MSSVSSAIMVGRMQWFGQSDCHPPKCVKRPFCGTDQACRPSAPDYLLGLVRTVSLLRGINAYLVSIKAGFAGLRQVTLPERAVSDFTNQIKRLANKLTPTAFVRGTKATARVDQLLGLEALAAFERQIDSFRRQFKDAFRGESFSDPESAARVT